MTWILIILWFPSTSQSGKDVHTQEFHTEQACLTAAKSIAAMQMSDLLRMLCVPKGIKP